MSVVFTVGHSTRSADEFLELLGANGVRALVDVRRYPGSRRYPYFNRESLSELLSTAGIAYHHAPELGGRRESTADSPNTFWKNASFRAYADYMSTPEFQTAFERLEQIAWSLATAIMCAEAVPWRCHRQFDSRRAGRQRSRGTAHPLRAARGSTRSECRCRNRCKWIDHISGHRGNSAVVVREPGLTRTFPVWPGALGCYSA